MTVPQPLRPFPPFPQVLLGLGLPWMMGAFYWASMGATPEWKAAYPDMATLYPGGGFVVRAGNRHPLHSPLYNPRCTHRHTYRYPGGGFVMLRYPKPSPKDVTPYRYTDHRRPRLLRHRLRLLCARQPRLRLPDDGHRRLARPALRGLQILVGATEPGQGFPALMCVPTGLCATENDRRRVLLRGWLASAEASASVKRHTGI